MGLPIRSALQRVGSAAAAGAVWWIVYKLTGRAGNAHGSAMAIASAVILVGYAGFIVWITYIPWPRRRYPDAMARGLTGLVLILLAVLGMLLAVGVYFHIGLLVMGVAFMTVVPLAIAIPPSVYGYVRAKGKERAARDRPIPRAELFDRLADHTHVIERTTTDPPRRWRELRYYTADGRMPGFKEEDGRIEPYPAAVTWRIQDGLLETVSSLAPEKTTRYKLMARSDGQIAYYFHEPGSQLHRLCGFHTIEIRAGEPQVTAPPVSGVVTSGDHAPAPTPTS